MSQTLITVSPSRAGIQSDTIDYSNPKLPSDYVLPRISDQYNYQFNVIFLGFNQSRFNMSMFEQHLPKWQAPIERIPSNSATGYLFDVNYTLSYNFEFLENSSVTLLRNFIDMHQMSDRAPYWMTNDTQAISYVDSYAVEDYLKTNYVDDGTPTFFFIDTYSLDPANHHPYFYNASNVDLDGASIPRRYGSQYQISGGGGSSRLLWLDLSSGPTKYRDTDYWGFVGVNETTVPPIWDYNTNPESKNQLAVDLSTYLSTAIELRMLPSYIYKPSYNSQGIVFDFKLINLDHTGYDWFDAINLNFIKNQYTKLNPNIEWSTSLEEINLDLYPTFKNIILSSKDEGLKTYTSYPIMEYLDANYSKFVSVSTKSRLVIPIFLFGFDEDYVFDNFLGVATSVRYEFSYILSSTNVYFATNGMKLSTANWIDETNLDILPNTYTTFSGKIGSTTEKIATTLTVNSGEVNIFLVDQENLKRYEDGQVPNDLHYQPGITGTHAFNETINIYSNLTWILENPFPSLANVDLNIDIYKDRSFGFTFVSMHEIGHALGLSHPHDGFTWHGNKYFKAETEYLYWLWDLSDTQMTYAHHYANISSMDIDTYQRGIFPKLYMNTYQQFYSVIDLLIPKNTFIPKFLVHNLDMMAANMTNALDLFSNSTDLNNYENAFDILENVNNLVVDSKQLIEENELTHLLQIQIFGQTTEIVQIEIFEHNSLLINESLTNDITYNLTELSWTDYTVKIYINGDIDTVSTGFTWSIPDSISVYMGSATPPPTSSSSDTTIPISSTDTDSGETNGNFSIPFNFSISLFFLLLIGFLRRNIPNKQLSNKSGSRKNK